MNKMLDGKLTEGFESIRMPRIAVRPAVRMEIKLLAERREAAAQTEMKEQTEAGTRTELADGSAKRRRNRWSRRRR